MTRKSGEHDGNCMQNMKEHWKTQELDMKADSQV